jgi:hypothetical protein
MPTTIRNKRTGHARNGRERTGLDENETGTGRAADGGEGEGVGNQGTAIGPDCNMENRQMNVERNRRRDAFRLHVRQQLACRAVIVIARIVMLLGFSAIGMFRSGRSRNGGVPMLPPLMQIERSARGPKDQ